MSMTFLAVGPAWLAAGTVLGAVYFLLVRRSLVALCEGECWRGAAGLLMLRIALAIGTFGVAALQGAGALLFTLTGFIFARTFAVSRVRRGR